MRLLKVVGKLEAAAAEAQEAERPAVGVAWSSAETVDAACLDVGEYIATDVTILGEIGGTEEWRTVERVTRDRNDLGGVFDAGGRRIGRVTAIDGSLVTLERAAPGPEPLPPAA